MKKALLKILRFSKHIKSTLWRYVDITVVSSFFFCRKMSRCKNHKFKFFFSLLWLRIYQDVELKLTKDITSGPLDKPYSHRQTNEGAENKNLLKFSPDDVVFYVGGYPSNFTVRSCSTCTNVQLTDGFMSRIVIRNSFLCSISPQPPPSMKLPKYTGCIEFSTFNRKFMSLYNFQNVERINVQTPCKRYWDYKFEVSFWCQCYMYVLF